MAEKYAGYEKRKDEDAVDGVVGFVDTEGETQICIKLAILQITKYGRKNDGSVRKRLRRAPLAQVESSRSLLYTEVLCS
jgi:hypothetical protein